MPLTTLEALWNHQVTAYTRLVKFVVRIHSGEPHIVVRTLSARYLTAIYALTAVLVASGGFRRGLSVSAADSPDRRKSQLRHSRVELAESLPWRRQGSPLFHRSGSVGADGLRRSKQRVYCNAPRDVAPHKWLLEEVGKPLGRALPALRVLQLLPH